MKMTTEEAFVKVLQRHGIEHVFGIIGSAFMPISDLFRNKQDNRFIALLIEQAEKTVEGIVVL